MDKKLIVIALLSLSLVGTTFAADVDGAGVNNKAAAGMHGRRVHGQEAREKHREMRRDHREDRRDHRHGEHRDAKAGAAKAY